MIHNPLNNADPTRFPLASSNSRIWLVPLVWLAMVNMAYADTFIGLGDLGGGIFESSATDISADGSVVVGRSVSTNGEEAFRWTQETGIVGLGDLPGGEFSSGARKVSADGSIVVGYGGSENGREAIQWSIGTGMVGIGDLVGGDFDSIAWGVSADGSTLVGSSISTNGVEAFRWKNGVPIDGLGDFPGGGFFSSANHASADGSIVVGEAESGNGKEAFVWTENDGMVGLGDLSGGNFESRAAEVTSDGSVIVGFGTTSTAEEAFRWTSETGMVGLGLLSVDGFSKARGVSENGKFIVGTATASNGTGRTAFIWDETNGMRSIQDILLASGTDLTGWTLEHANAISADGSTIIGRGINPDGNHEAWRATVSAVPEPSMFALLGIGGLGLIVRRRFNKR